MSTDERIAEKRPPVYVRCYRADSWIRKAGELKDSGLDGKFIFYWIAFNALYGQPKYLSHKTGPEERDLERFLELITELDASRHIPGALSQLKWPVQALTEDNYLNDHCWVGWYERSLDSLSQREKHASLDRRRGSDLPQLFRRIYVLRKQLFHGCSSDKGSKNREALVRTVAVLEKLVPIFRDLTHAHAAAPRVTKLLGELPYPPTIGGTG